jgi:hypothetical protein
MAKKKSKGSKRAADHGKNLAGAMKSVSTSKTPIATLYPKKVTVGSSKTSPRFMQRGTKSPSKSATPQKLLLQVSNPGAQPAAPDAVSAPGLNPSVTVKGTTRPSATWAAGQDRNFQAGFNPTNQTFLRGAAGTAAQNTWNAANTAYTAQVTAYNNYQSQIRQYTTQTLPDWTAANTQYTRDTARNVDRTSKYNQDVAKFVKSLGKKSKVSSKSAKKAGGARGYSRSGSRGSR